MINIVARNFIKPDCKQAFIETAEELIQKSRAEEGNVFYTLNISKTDSKTLTFIESWKDQAALDIHHHSEHFLRIISKLEEFCEREADVELFDEIIVS